MNEARPAAEIPHPYRAGYSVLPRLRKISHNEVFQYNATHHQRCLAEKQLAQRSQVVEVEANLHEELRDAIYEFLIKNYPVPLTASHSLSGLAMQMQEDFIIHALTEERDWMAYGHVCLPSSWRPEDKIGQELSELHAPIPGMNLAMSRKLVETMVHHGPFERFIWSVVHEDRLNFHPELPARVFDPQHPVLFVKVERQVTVGFPQHNGALFLLCESLIPASALDHSALALAIRNMNAAERAYKGLENCESALLPWLDHFRPACVRDERD